MTLRPFRVWGGCLATSTALACDPVRSAYKYCQSCHFDHRAPGSTAHLKHSLQAGGGSISGPRLLPEQGGSELHTLRVELRSVDLSRTWSGAHSTEMSGCESRTTSGAKSRKKSPTDNSTESSAVSSGLEEGTLCRASFLSPHFCLCSRREKRPHVVRYYTRLDLWCHRVMTRMKA